jgi:protein-L-isoaspartate(D-aspartate) O-methyltransferase
MTPHPTTPEQLNQARFNMVEQQVRTWDVLDERVLAVLHEVAREEFVRTEHRAMAYADVELPLAAGIGKLFKPVLDGRILQSIALTGDEDVLEIGAGSGYTSACLAKLARRVHSIDTQAQAIERAAATLKAMGIFNASFDVADGLSNFAAKYKFDVIVLGGAVAQLPSALFGLLNPNGRIFAVRGFSPVMEGAMFSGSSQTPVVHSLFETDIPYLFGGEPPVPKFAL